MTSRQINYGAGVLAMAGLLAAAIFGSVGHLADPYAARGAVVGTFLVVQYQRYVCRAVLTWHVAVSSFVFAVLAAVLCRAFWHGPLRDFTGEAGEVAAASLLAATAMTLSFYFLTLRRGRML